VTTKYSTLSFIPKSLILQFAKFANCFYLFNSILQCIESVATNDPLASIIPLAYVVLLGMLKEFIADYKRKKSDHQVNKYGCTRLLFTD